MAETNMCNRFDFVSNGRVVYKGTQFTEYEEVEQPKPEEPEEKKFDGSSLTGKVLGAVAAAGCVAAAFGLVAAWGVSAAFSGGAAFAAAPLVWQGFAFLMAAAPIVLEAGSAISEQYNQDMTSQKDSGWGTYAKLGILDPIKVGAQDVVLGFVGGSAFAGAGRLMGKIIKTKSVSPAKIISSFEQRIAALRESMPNNKLKKGGNMAMADVDIPGLKTEYVAHSRINASANKGAELGEFSYFKPENERAFTTYVEDGGFSRYHDTEAKILEDIASQIKNKSTSGSINLYTELPACQSCTNIIFEFRGEFPNIKLNIFTGK